MILEQRLRARTRGWCDAPRCVWLVRSGWVLDDCGLKVVRCGLRCDRSSLLCVSCCSCVCVCVGGSNCLDFLFVVTVWTVCVVERFDSVLQVWVIVSYGHEDVG
jgi:hypothetical protein